MGSKAWAWCAVVGALVVGCSGRVSVEQTGGVAGGGSAQPSSGDGPGPFPVPPSSTGPAGAPNRSENAPEASNGGSRGDAGGFDEEVGGGDFGPCEGTLAEVSEAWGFSCPKDIGSGTTLAGDCDSLPSDVIRTSVSNDRINLALAFELSGQRSKLCFYGGTGCPETLIGATILETGGAFCDGSSLNRGEERAGITLKPPLGDDPHVFTLCDRAHPEKNQPNAAPARACRNRFSNSCEVCCPETQPDCSKEPENPSSMCTPNTREGSYCSCGCVRGQWNCGC